MEAEILEATTQELMMHDYPSDCCPEGCYLKFPCIAGDPDSPFWQGWGNLRIKTFRLIENKYFETAVITMILISSLALVKKSEHLLFVCFVLLDAQERQIEIATPGKRASHRLGYSSHPDNLISTQLCS